MLRLVVMVLGFNVENKENDQWLQITKLLQHQK